MVALPRFELDDESTYGDDTRPVQFTLKLPPSFTVPTPRTPFPTPPAPWVMDAPKARAPAKTNLRIVLASAILGGVVAVVGLATSGSAPASPTAREQPVGIAMRAPKTLDKSLRTRDRIGGVSLQTNAVTVSIDSLARSRRRRF